ncbi:MAG: LysR family transcriptional regulator, partial [Sandaracinaceae bacterium]|nr:LysR family transcriptional regulator [Sandaracinaceae bacterium]
MELRQLRYFVAAAEERHFTRAAARCHVAQSGLSATIKALENELGTQLLHRTTRRVELTEAGRLLLPAARATLQAAESAEQAIVALGRELAG